MATEPKADEFAVSDTDSNTLKSLKLTAANVAAHIAKREAHVKTLKTAEEQSGHQETLASERANLANLRKEIAAQSK